MPHSDVSVFPMMFPPHLTTFAAFHERVAFQQILDDPDVTTAIAFVEETLLIADCPEPTSKLSTFRAPFAPFESSGFTNPGMSANVRVFQQTEIQPREYEPRKIPS